jgi:hypothetical protein
VVSGHPWGQNIFFYCPGKKINDFFGERIFRDMVFEEVWLKYDSIPIRKFGHNKIIGMVIPFQVLVFLVILIPIPKKSSF